MQCPPACRQAGFHNFCQYFFCFPPFYTFVCSNPPHRRKNQMQEQKGEKREEIVRRENSLQNIDQNFLKTLKFGCFLQLPSFTLRSRSALRKWKTLTSRCEGTVAQSNCAGQQHQGVHRCQATSFPNDPRSSVSSQK